MDPVIKRAAQFVLRGVLPYPDLVRRRRTRAAARALVGCSPWPEDQAITGGDLAELALLRLLSLQTDTRRAVRSRQREAAALLARSSLEACILGLYCLHCPDAVAALRASHLKTGAKMLAFLGEADVVPPTVIDQAWTALGPQKQGPNVKEMTQQVDAATGGSLVAGMYDRLYVPTSTFFVHANPSSLLRHVKADNTLLGRPVIPWARRSPARLADACVGALAAEIAERKGVQSSGFMAYAESHYARVMPPV